MVLCGRVGVCPCTCALGAWHLFKKNDYIIIKDKYKCISQTFSTRTHCVEVQANRSRLHFWRLATDTWLNHKTQYWSLSTPPPKLTKAPSTRPCVLSSFSFWNGCSGANHHLQLLHCVLPGKVLEEHKTGPLKYKGRVVSSESTTSRAWIHNADGE